MSIQNKKLGILNKEHLKMRNFLYISQYPFNYTIKTCFFNIFLSIIEY